MWWISYRGEGKAGVDNIGVFEDDGTPRKRASAAPRPVARCAPAAHRPRLRARGRRSLHRQRLAQGQPRRPLPPPRRHVPLRRSGGGHQARLGDGPPLRRGARRRRPALRVLPGHQHRRRHPAEDAQAGAGGARTCARPFPRETSFPARSSPPARASFPKSATSRRWTCRRRRASRWCSTCTASPGTPCAGSSCTASISTWRTRRGTRSRSSR